MRFRILILLLFLSNFCFSQGFTFNCSKDTSVVGCASSCITLKTIIPDLRSSTSSYLINNVNPVGSCYLPPVAPDHTGGASANLTIDDRYSSVIGIGFPFTFFGTTYTQLVVSANGYLSFDITRATRFSHFGILRTGDPAFLAGGSGTPEDLPSLLYDRALIMGPYHDLDPSKTTSPTRRVQYQVVGTAPYRRWVLSYYKVPLFSNPCNTLIENTHQIVLYESTGVIEIYIQDMEVCTAWNQGRAMVGIQNMDRDIAYMAPGRKASDTPWGSIGMNEVWRFVPAAGGSLFKRAELYDRSGNMVSSTTSGTPADGNLEIAFPNVCSPVGTTEFIVKSVYSRIDNSAQEVAAYDTIRVHKTPVVINATVSTLPSQCSPANGEITVNTTAGKPPFTYSVLGRPYQSSNVLSNVPAGDHIVTVRDSIGCPLELAATVGLIDNLSLQAMADTVICEGDQFRGRINSNAASYLWTPAAGVSNTSDKEPLLSPVTSTTYIVEGELGTCKRSDTIAVQVNPAPDVSAGPDHVIIEGDVVTLNGSGSAGTYLWSPPTALSSPSQLKTNAAPSVTTTYTLRITDAKSCSATDDATITVFPNCVRPIEAFTPNGDGINELFLVTNGNCTNAVKLQVFNRYGAMVYSSDNYQNNWDGKYKGERLADGTYYYVITASLVSGKTTLVKGNVTILR